MTLKTLIINRQPLVVTPKEFSLLHHQEYNNLKIYPILNKLEREVGLLIDLAECFTSPANLLLMTTEHTSYFALHTHLYFQHIYIHPLAVTDVDQAQAINKNILQNQTITNVSVNFHIDSNTIVFIDNYKTGTYKELPKSILQLIKQHKPLLVTTALKEPKRLCLKVYKQLYELQAPSKSSRLPQLYPQWYKGIYKLVGVPNHLHTSFTQSMKFFIKTSQSPPLLAYDNLINLCVMVKNGGEEFKKMLNANLDFIDQWTILDTGSTDDTVDNIKSILVDKKKGLLVEEPFINFRDSRNRCLNLAGKRCKFNVMLDDTYVLSNNLRNFLNLVRGDQFADSYSLMIRSDDNEYYSNRVLKSSLDHLRYIYTIHEVITPHENKVVVIPPSEAFIFDARTEYMEARTHARKQYDLKCLYQMVEEYPDEPRHLYYIAQTMNELERYEEAAEYFLKRAYHYEEGFNQERYSAIFEAARLYNFKLNRPWEQCKRLYEIAAEYVPERPEAFYFIGAHYYINNQLELAYDYFKKAFTIGYPLHLQYALKPTLSFYYLPKLLGPMCFAAKDYKLGYIVTKYFLDNNPNNKFGCTDEDRNLMTDWLNVFEPLTLYLATKPSFKNFIGLAQEQTTKYAFVLEGTPDEWDLSCYDVRTVVWKLLQHCAAQENVKVYVYCDNRHLDKRPDVNNVVWCTQKDLVRDLTLHNFKHYIAVDFVSLLPVVLEASAAKIHLVIPYKQVSNRIIPISDQYVAVYCQSNKHFQEFTAIWPALKPWVQVLNLTTEPTHKIVEHMFSRLESKQ